jgi:hypothetical protein
MRLAHHQQEQLVSITDILFEFALHSSDTIFFYFYEQLAHVVRVDMAEIATGIV